MDISDIISMLRKKYEQSYGFAVFDLAGKEEADRLVVCGTVLTENQKAELFSELKKFSEKEIEDDVRVLSDPESEGIGWAIVAVPIADQKSRFVSNKIINEKIRKRIRASQLKEGDVLRVLFQKEDQILGQSGDMTIGWTDIRDVKMGDETARKKWQKGIAARSGELVAVGKPKGKLIREAERFLGVKYVLGARSEEAIDCSALMQLVYKRALDVILPRHSWDQKKMGVAVELFEAETGDLIFMINKKTGIRHVGMLEVLSDGKNIIHASRSMGGVVRQDMKRVLEEYTVAEIRRIARSD